MNQCLVGLAGALAIGSAIGACSDTGNAQHGDAGENAGGNAAEAGWAGGKSDGASAGMTAGGDGNQDGGRPSSGNGGSDTAGQGTGQAGLGGQAGQGGQPTIDPTAFMLGADLSSTQETSYTYVDVDGEEKSLLDLLKNHGFNYVRLKSFVDPEAPYGYASTENNCPGLPEAYGDRDHVIAFGKQVKQAGMGFLLDLHYSDVWADPGNQIIPQAWRGAADINALAALAKAYTKDVITTAIAEGARPDMVQVGNEITPGIMMHVPGPSTDCWGNNPVAAPFGGSTSNWKNVATLLTAGIEGVREVDPTIQIMLHIENTDDLGGVRWWVDNVLANKVSFDVLGLSCYTQFQDQPAVWQTTFNDLVKRYPTLKFAIAEYNEERTKANLMMKNLPNGRGLGTFFWEPTRSGEWGPALFSFDSGTATAVDEDFAEFDALRPQLGL